MKPGQAVRPVIFGEVLFDRFPDGAAVLGGAPFNVAWHLQAFGFQPLFISRVGDDASGDEIRQAMCDWGMDIAGLQTDGGHATGSVEVSFTDGEPHYDIVKPSAWDFIDADELPELPDECFLYHGSLALRHDVSAQALDEIRRRTHAPRFVDINLRPPWWQIDSVRRLLGDARWVKLNEHELEMIQPGAKGEELLHDREGFVALTHGARGASLIMGEARHEVRPEPNADFVDAVGAGDAFASVLLAGIAGGWPPAVALQRAQAFASAVVGIRGAVSRDRRFYQRCIDAWDD